MTLLICRTCPRYDTTRTGAFSHDLARSLGVLPAGNAPRLRYVQCLGGCPHDGVAAVDAPGKARVRFTGLRADHAEALAGAARAHDDSVTGSPDDWVVPTDLRSHISSVTLKRPPVTTAPSRWHDTAGQGVRTPE